MRHTWYLFSLCLLLTACRSQEPRQITKGFYYWKQRYTADSTEQHTLSALHVQRLYLRAFDVRMDPATQQPVPVAPVDIRSKIPDSTRIVPVVFLMNDIWRNTDSIAVTQLAHRVSQLLLDRYSSIPAHHIPEIQIDCDWTRQQKEIYFAFLRAFRQTNACQGRQLSATIRMHQVKYLSANGIPPVDKGLLMCYNMGDLRKWGDHNSILNMKELKAYIAPDHIQEYPLPLDLALPLFEWSVLFSKFAYTGILRSMGDKELADSKLFTPTGAYTFTCRKDTILNGYPLREGDVIRRETTGPALLKQAAQLIARQRQQYEPTIIFYHLDSLTLSKYTIDELEDIYHLFR
ncbi:hypothetical protein KTO58_24870 [Chitinophaga pendula]|uniref:hypothetical protein n=1 Tax=Chitinophaga TaxID=79328 RepID=UPI000BAE963D|nr:MULTISPECIES: hypothetical protein [Chitinophaga]ASZ10184.1 hypothetical protein CK934_03900 [Chitinophaga sp. MD30]UCJ06861.1 hypothetical protein KTO58_24870 [Chitinophaga pendula]